MQKIVEIKFGVSKSSKYKKALSVAKSLPNFSVASGVNSFFIDSVNDYIVFQYDIYWLISCISSWKNASVLLYGREYSSALDLYNFKEKVGKAAGKYKCLLEKNDYDGVALNAVTHEELPLPIVFYPPLYGAFFAFAEELDKELIFCECERNAIHNYIKLRTLKPVNSFPDRIAFPLGTKSFPQYIAEQSVEWANDLESHIKFKKNLCFRCNKKVPKLKYCHPMYGGQFMQHYGWYVKQEYYRLGIDKYQIMRMNVLPDECTPELYDGVKRIHWLMNHHKDDEYYYDKLRNLNTELDHAIENSVREQMGFKKIGDAWVSETMLFQIIQELFPNENVIRHQRPEWLEGLELDIFIPEKKLAFEYQGIQHFKPIKHWGGEEKLKIQQEHDARKKRLCAKCGVRLICVNYDEDLSSEHIKSLIG